MIISIVGLPCAGKTTLAEGLRRAWGVRIHPIGEFRNRYRDEDKAWCALERLLHRHDRPARRPKDCIIVVSTGLNYSYHRAIVGVQHLATIKLVAPKRVLLKRLKSREPHEDGWFPYELTRVDFIQDFQHAIRRLKADLVIDTSQHSIPEMIKIVEKFVVRRLGTDFRVRRKKRKQRK